MRPQPANNLHRDAVGRGAMPLVAVLILALVLRLPGLFTDLWLDEIWSLDAVEGMRSPLEVFTAFRSDNNHHLNSLWLWLVGPGGAAWAHRLAALAGGLAAVVFAWLLGARDDRRVAWVSAALTAVSLPMVVYSSEARGYSLVVASALGAWYFLQRYADEPTWGRAWLVWVCATLGVLSHLSIVHTLVALAAWLSVRERARRDSWAAVVPTVARALGVPALVLGLFAWLVLRGSILGGGPPYSLVGVLVETLASVAGIVGEGRAALAAAVVVASLFLAGIAVLARDRDDRWVFFIVAVVLAPGFLLVAARPPFLFVRYFATEVAFVLLVIALMVGPHVRLPLWGRRLAWASVAALVALNLLAVVGFWSVGRGHYQQALADACAESPGGYASVTSDHDFRNGTTVNFYVNHGQPGCQVEYLPAAALPSSGAEWFIVHALDPADPARADISDLHANHYTYVRTYPAHRFSGLTWHLYRASRP